MRNFYKELGIDDKIVSLVNKAEKEILGKFSEIDEICEYNQLKVLTSMQESGLDVSAFNITTGYGYNDYGRDKLEEVYARIFNTESALVRPQIVCGTQALYLAIAGNTRPNDEILSPTGPPYDTLQEVIGIRESKGSLREYNIGYREVDFLPDYSFDYDGIRKAINSNTKMIIIQRSRGYSKRPSLSIERLKDLISFVKNIKKDVIVMVDNCYGEFTEIIEPSDIGADMIVGSLIKNPGGGLAPSGGYIAGKKEYVENAGVRLNSPGLGMEVGSSLGLNHLLFQGLFLSPSVTASAMKSAILLSKVYEILGFKTSPLSSDRRCDIIQSIELRNKENVLAFCLGIQKAAPVDSFVTPIASYMPGYSDDVVMASGSFIQGSSIELSADAPIREPYLVFFQGGLTYSHGKIGVMKSVQELVNIKGVSL